MKALVTGSSGYIGSHLIKILKNQNYLIYGLDIKEPILNYYDHYYTNIISSLDIEQKEFDCVIHLAAKVNVSESVSNPTLYYETNVLGTLNLLKRIRTKNFIFSSTGAAEQLNSPYGLSKKVAEEIISEFCLKNNIRFTLFRFYNVIGSDGISPTNPDGLFYNLIKAKNSGFFNLYGNDFNTIDGSCVRDYVHVNEICNSIVKAITAPSNKIENLGHGKGYSVKEIIKIFKKVNNCDFNIKICDKRPGDLETSVLKKPSPYMKQIYSIDQLLKIKQDR